MEIKYEDVKKLIDDSLTSIKSDIKEIKETTKPINGLVERLANYKDLEDTVNAHDFILNGIKDTPGIIHEIKQLKNHGKRVFDWIVKIFAFAGSVLGVLALLKSFNAF